MYCKANSRTYTEGPIFSVQFCSSPPVMEKVCDSFKNSTYVSEAVPLFTCSICVSRRRKLIQLLARSSNPFIPCFFNKGRHTFSFFGDSPLKLYNKRATNTSAAPITKQIERWKWNTNFDTASEEKLTPGEKDIHTRKHHGETCGEALHDVVRIIHHRCNQHS